MSFFPESSRGRRVLASTVGLGLAALVATATPETTSATPNVPAVSAQAVGGRCLAGSVTVLSPEAVRASVTYTTDSLPLLYPGAVQLGFNGRSIAGPDTLVLHGDEITATTYFNTLEMKRLGFGLPPIKSWQVDLDALPMKGGGDDGVHCGPTDLRNVWESPFVYSVAPPDLLNPQLDRQMK